MLLKSPHDNKCRQIFFCLTLLVLGTTLGRLSLLSTSSSALDRSLFTFIPKMNRSELQCVIVSTAIKLPLLSIYRFVRSARSSCNSCTIIIFIDDINNRDYQQLAVLYQVLFLAYDKHASKKMKRLSIYSSRFLVYYHYLLNHPQFDRIFVCDLSDTLFQMNIFEQMDEYPTGQLYAFLESEQLTIGGCPLHRQWISSCYGSKSLNTIFNQSRACAGSILGTYEGMMRYLSLMNTHITTRPQCNDQGIHNYLMYFILNDTSTIRVTHETGFLGTFGTSEWMYRNKYGLVLNKNERVYSVIHQFHQSKQLQQQADREYQILPESILRLKH